MKGKVSNSWGEAILILLVLGVCVWSSVGKKKNNTDPNVIKVEYENIYLVPSQSDDCLKTYYLTGIKICRDVRVQLI